MNKYLALYRSKKIEVTAPTSYEAQLKAASIFKAKRSFDVSVYLTDVTHTATD
jgi:hypothetical protein